MWLDLVRELVVEHVPSEDRTAALTFASTVVETAAPGWQIHTGREELARLTVQVLPAALIDEGIEFATAVERHTGGAVTHSDLTAWSNTDAEFSARVVAQLSAERDLMDAIWDATGHLYNTEYFHPVIALLARAAAIRGDSDPPKFIGRSK